MKHAAFALLLLISATAQADEGRILITAPQVITTPGSYLLANELACTKFCIEIEASDVKLDLTGFTLRQAPGHSSSGVLFGVNTKNIEVTNGAITGFPVCGVHVSGTSQFGRNLRISNLRISDNVIF